MKLRQFIQRKGISTAIIATVILVGCSSLLSFYVRIQVDQFNQVKDQVAEAKRRIVFISTYIHLIDMGVRGYLLVPDEQMLLPYEEGYAMSLPNIDTLGMILESQNYPNLEANQTTRRVLAEYREIVAGMIRLAKTGQTDQALEILKSDPGYDAWMAYRDHLHDTEAFEDALYQEARTNYQRIVDLSMVMQVLLVVLGIPTLLFVMYQINRANKNRALLFQELESSQRKYLYDDKVQRDQQDDSTVISQLIENLEKASGFVKKISEGDYSVRWEGISDDNREANQENLAGALIQMREQMKERKQEDQQRLWTTEGLSKVAEITRTHQDELQQLADSLLSYLVTYTKANQGSLFFLQEDQMGQACLTLTACYAYDKKKHAEKSIKLGQGLVGQTYLERKTLQLTRIPDQYVSITSGLGEATPSTLLLVPLIFNEQVMGVLEVAAFEMFAPHQVAFLESVGEVIASAVATVRMNSQTKQLLAQSQEGTEALRAQEEEMRQNMEELQATQEEMQRKTQEYEAVIEQQKEKIQQLEQIGK